MPVEAKQLEPDLKYQRPSGTGDGLTRTLLCERYFLARAVRAPYQRDLAASFVETCCRTGKGTGHLACDSREQSIRRRRPASPPAEHNLRRSEPTDSVQPHLYWLRYGASVALVTGEQLGFIDLRAQPVQGIEPQPPQSLLPSASPAACWTRWIQKSLENFENHSKTKGLEGQPKTMMGHFKANSQWKQKSTEKQSKTKSRVIRH